MRRIIFNKKLSPFVFKNNKIVFYISGIQKRSMIIISFKYRACTINWYKKLAQFCVSSNFEYFYKILEPIDQGAFSSVFLVS